MILQLQGIITSRKQAVQFLKSHLLWVALHVWRTPPPEFGFFCSYFQNIFSIACLRERNPSAKQEKNLS